MPASTNIAKATRSRRPTREHRLLRSPFVRPGELGVAALSLTFFLTALVIPRPAWAQMWLLCAALFFAAKVAVLPPRDIAAFTFCWPGMDARSFSRTPTRRLALLGRGLTSVLIGLALIFIIARLAPSAFAGTWIAMIGLILALHCGVFTLLAAYWRGRGRDVSPLMEAPLLAASVTEFWGRRWNHAFRDAAHECLFKPTTRRFGAKAGVWAVFLVSGLAHEVVISVPARAGFGGPTLYFALQAAAMLLERGCSIHSRLVWRLRALVFLGAPLPLLFHEPFVTNVCLPFFKAIHALP